MRKGLLPVAVICFLLSCSSSKNSNSSAGDERRKIASFILVKSLPVNISTKDETLGNSLKRFVSDTLKAMGYKFISQEERNIMEKRFYADLYGARSKDDAKRVMERAKGDNNYYKKETEKASPLEQYVFIQPHDSAVNKIRVLRRNFPYTTKSREWLIPYEDNELVTTIAARIVDSITARQNH